MFIAALSLFFAGSRSLFYEFQSDARKPDTPCGKREKVNINCKVCGHVADYQIRSIHFDLLSLDDKVQDPLCSSWLELLRSLVSVDTTNKQNAVTLMFTVDCAVTNIARAPCSICTFENVKISIFRGGNIREQRKRFRLTDDDQKSLFMNYILSQGTTRAKNILFSRPWLLVEHVNALTFIAMPN